VKPLSSFDRQPLHRRRRRAAAGSQTGCGARRDAPDRQMLADVRPARSHGGPGLPGQPRTGLKAPPSPVGSARDHTGTMA